MRFFVFVFLLFPTFLCSGNSNFSIDYAHSTPKEVQTVVDSVALYWSRYVKSTKSIIVKVEWVQMDLSVLSACSPTSYYKNFKNAPLKDVMYPVALAEKFALIDLNQPNQPDILLRINKEQNWYCGLDGVLPANMNDLFTILLHEFAHGLGLISNCKPIINNSDLGKFQFSLFDYFVSNSKGLSLVNIDVSKDTGRFNDFLTSNDLFFKGKFALMLNDGDSIKLFSPIKYDEGSSVNHLDEHAYPKGDSNSLMTPRFDKNGEVVHSMGLILQGIMSDLGWTDNLLNCSIVNDYEKLDSNLVISAYVDSILPFNNLMLHFSFDRFSNDKKIIMDFDSIKGCFYASIPSLDFDHYVSYYVTANHVSDSSLVVGVPSFYNKNFYSFFVGKDTVKPTILHDNIIDIPEDSYYLTIKAEVFDNVGVDSVWVKYKIKDVDKKDRISVLSKVSGSVYVGVVDLRGIMQGSKVLYKVMAADKAIVSNVDSTVGGEPLGYYKINVVDRRVSISSFDENFESPESLFKKMSLEGFSVQMPTGFSNYGLHTSHPYLNSSGDGMYNNITATILSPIRLSNGDAFLSFDEICLLELASSGTSYGDHEFWDYCIVEGSKDKNEWYPFEHEGYKTELYDDWVSTYKSDLFDEGGKISSRAQGKESLYKRHTINLLNNKYLRRGDDVYIRFRMFSDFHVNGWGWAIDNISVRALSLKEDDRIMASDLDFSIVCQNGLVFVPTDKKITSLICSNILGQRQNIELKTVVDGETVCFFKGNKGVYYLRVELIDGNFLLGKIIVL